MHSIRCPLGLETVHKVSLCTAFSIPFSNLSLCTVFGAHSVLRPFTKCRCAQHSLDPVFRICRCAQYLVHTRSGDRSQSVGVHSILWILVSESVCVHSFGWIVDQASVVVHSIWWMPFSGFAAVHSILCILGCETIQKVLVCTACSGSRFLKVSACTVFDGWSIKQVSACTEFSGSRFSNLCCRCAQYLVHTRL